MKKILSNSVEMKLEELRKALGQTLIVHLGLPAEGGFDILGVECLGGREETPEEGKVQPKQKQTEKLSYVG